MGNLFRIGICFLVLVGSACAFDESIDVGPDASATEIGVDAFLGPYHVPGTKVPPRPYAAAEVLGFEETDGADEDDFVPDLAEEALFVGIGDECQSDLDIPDYYGGLPHHDHYFTNWGCGYSGTGTVHSTCNSAMCLGPPSAAGNSGVTLPGSTCYCLTATGGCGNFNQCWDVSNPCAPFRKLPAPTAATCPAGRPFCDVCIGTGFQGLVFNQWGHHVGPDGICKTADDVYKPYVDPDFPHEYGYPGYPGCLRSGAETE